MQRETRNGLAVVLPFMIVTLIWGSTWVVIRGQLDLVPPAWSVSYRFLIAGTVMLGIVLARGERLWLGREGMIFAVLIGLTQFAVNFNFVYLAERGLTSGIVALIFSLMIIPNSLAGRLLYGDPLSRGFLLGSAIAVTGILLLLAHEYHGISNDPARVMLSVAFTLGGVFCSSASNLLQARPSARSLPAMSVLCWAMLSGAAMDVVWAWLTEGPPVIATTPGYLLGLLYLAVAGSVITYPLYYHLIRNIGVGPAAYVGVVVPVVAMLMSTLLEAYSWSPTAVAGALLAFVGMVVAMRSRQSAASPSR